MKRVCRQLALVAAATFVASCVVSVRSADAQPPRVSFPQSRYDVAAYTSLAATTSSPPTPPAWAPTPTNYDPYSTPTPPSPLAQLFGVRMAQAYAPIGPPPTAVMAPPAGAAPYYSYQPATILPAGPSAMQVPVMPAGKGFRPGWYAELGAVFLDRDDRINDRALLIDDDPPLNADNNFLRTNNIDFNYEVGPRVILGYDFNQRIAWEAMYYGVYSWDWSANVTALDDVNVPGDLGLVPALDFFNADTATVTLDSTFHNFELNRISCLNSCLAWLAGFRYVRLTEDFALRTTDFGFLAPGGSSRYTIDTTNNLYGGQLGFRLRQLAGDFSFDVLGKAGVYGNTASQKTFVGDDAGFVLRNSETSATDVAFVGDLAFTGRYHVSSTVALEGGYSVMWIEGLALAPDQLDFTNTATSGQQIDNDGGIFIHGAHAGILVIW
jgi:hypothetical protein